MMHAEYIESGSFQGGEEQASETGFKPGDDAVVLTKAEYAALTISPRPSDATNADVTLLLTLAREAEGDARGYENHEHGPYIEAAQTCRDRAAALRVAATKLYGLQMILNAAARTPCLGAQDPANVAAWIAGAARQLKEQS